MKKLLQHIQVLAMLVLVSAGIVSCSKDLPETGDAEVSFTATLPAGSRTRAFGDGTSIDTLVVGVFNKSDQVDRKEFPVSGATVDVSLTLAQGQTYSFVFWAYNKDSGIYDTDDLTGIKMNAQGQPATFKKAEAADAFFAVVKDVAITGNSSRSVELVRPLAQINVGTTGKAVAATFTVKGVPDTFHPFTNTVSGETNYTWDFTGTTEDFTEATTEKFTMDGVEYNYLAMGYLFAPVEGMQVEAELSLMDNGQVIKLPQVELQANRRSNIIGRFTD